MEEVLTGVVENPILFGWYHRERTDTYEFWWANQPMVVIDAMMLDVMPTYLVHEIRASAMVKRELTD